MLEAHLAPCPQPPKSSSRRIRPGGASLISFREHRHIAPLRNFTAARLWREALKALLVIYMNRKSKTPRRVVAMSYEPRIKSLTVAFDDGRVYRYCRVPKSVFNALRLSSSSEIHFQRHVKDRYPVEPVS